MSSVDATGALTMISAATASALRGSAFRVDPATASAPDFIASTSRAAHSGAGSQSSSVKNTKRPLALATPALRAPAGPEWSRRMTRANECRPTTSATARGSADPSSTTITSNSSNADWTARASRQRRSDSGRSRVGTMTEITGDPSAGSLETTRCRYATRSMEPTSAALNSSSASTSSPSSR